MRQRCGNSLGGRVSVLDEKAKRAYLKSLEYLHSAAEVPMQFVVNIYILNLEIFLVFMIHAVVILEMFKYCKMI